MDAAEPCLTYIGREVERAAQVLQNFGLRRTHQCVSTPGEGEVRGRQCSTPGEGEVRGRQCTAARSRSPRGPASKNRMIVTSPSRIFNQNMCFGAEVDIPVSRGYENRCRIFPIHDSRDGVIQDLHHRSRSRINTLAEGRTGHGAPLHRDLAILLEPESGSERTLESLIFGQKYAKI